MMCFKDKTFCASSDICANKDCGRNLTPELIREGKDWWSGNASAPSSWMGAPATYDEALKRMKALAARADVIRAAVFRAVYADGHEDLIPKDMILRYPKIFNNRVVYYELKPHKNHSKEHFHPVYRGSRLTQSEWVKKLCAAIYRFTGVMI